MDVLDFLLILMALIMLSGMLLDKFEKHREHFIDEMLYALKKTRREFYSMKYRKAPLEIQMLVALNYIKAIDILLTSFFAKIFCRKELIVIFGREFIDDIKREDILKELSKTDKLITKFIG